MAQLKSRSGLFIFKCFSVYRYDSDNERVKGDVGMAGVAIDSVEDTNVSVPFVVLVYVSQFTKQLALHPANNICII